MNKKHYKFLDLKDVNAPLSNEINDAVSRVVNSGRYIGGPEVQNFEKILAETVGGGVEATGVSNGLDALRLIFRAYIEMGEMKPETKSLCLPTHTSLRSSPLPTTA